MKVLRKPPSDPHGSVEPDEIDVCLRRLSLQGAVLLRSCKAAHPLDSGGRGGGGEGVENPAPYLPRASCRTSV